MSKESKMIDKLIEIDKQMKGKVKDMKVYVILSDTKVLVDNGCCKSYDTETEIYAILDNESGARELVDRLNLNAQSDTHYSYIRSCVTSK